MNQPLEELLRAMQDGRLTVEAAAAQLSAMSIQPLAYATLDHDRHARCGAAEVIYAAGKTTAQVVEIAEALVERSRYALITRAESEQADALDAAFRHVIADAARRTLIVGHPPMEQGTAIPIVSAGTSDQRVADEAALTCRALGQRVRRITDVGVAGLHRLTARLSELRETGVIVCIAGMEGALPSVVGGLVACPVIAVPTSVGYGASFAGLSALLGMLTSCAAGVTVVNIDNGFGAAYTATMIQRLYDKREPGDG